MKVVPKEIKTQAGVDYLIMMFHFMVNRLVTLCVIEGLLIAAMGIGWMIDRSQFEAVETTTEIQQESDNYGSNYIVGGDFNGDPKDKNQNKEVCP